MKTPKLKMPQLKRPKGGSSGLKPPKVVADLYADLRDRRLLPLVALLAVAIVAAPFLLANDSSPEPAFVPAPAAPPATAASFKVVPAQSELRDYRKRLEHRKRESPFSTYAAVRASNQTREEVEGVIETGESGGEIPPSNETGAVESPTEYAPAQPPAIHADVTATVGVEAVIKAGFVPNELKEMRIPAQTKLPNPKKPDIVYTGPSKDGRGALFLMSNDVTAYYGKGRCVLGGEVCQVLELNPKHSATFAIGYGETRYKVSLLGFVPVVKEEKINVGG